jgi:hypothetical protein
MNKLIPFPTRRVQTFVDCLLISSASITTLSRPTKWGDRPVPSEPLGNMLQRLAIHRPGIVLLLENVVADILKRIDES